MWSHTYSTSSLYILRYGDLSCGSVPAEELEPCHGEDTAPYKDKSCCGVKAACKVATPWGERVLRLCGRVSPGGIQTNEANMATSVCVKDHTPRLTSIYHTAVVRTVPLCAYVDVKSKCLHVPGCIACELKSKLG